MVLPCVTEDAVDVLLAAQLAHRHKLSFWDAAVIRDAVKAHCGTLFSEELQSGRKIDGLLIENPFL